MQLPRDWLGPREELVPFGPRAWEPDASADLSEDAAGAFAAEDFWGENSESLHTAVRAPVTVSPADPMGGGDGAAPRADAQAAPAPPDRTTPRLPRRFPLGLPVVAAVVLAVAATAVLNQGGGQRPAGAPVMAASANAETITGHLSSTGAAIDAGVRDIASARLSTAGRVHRHGSPARRHHRSAGRTTAAIRPQPAAARPSVTAQPVQSYTPAASSASAPVTTSPSGSSSAGASSSSASSSNQPAFGANGTLGPGSSPNG